MLRGPNVHLFPLLRNQRGVALLYLVILFALLGVLVSFAVRKFGATVKQGKVNEVKRELERDVQMIIAWSRKNGRLPAFADYSASVFGSKPMDAWGKPVVFAFYSSLTKISTGGLCGRSSSTISHNGQNVAFLLLSGGDDMNISSTPNSNGFYNGVLSGLVAEDLYRIVTMNELTALAGCAGSTSGALRIANNELPSACKRRNYSATIFPDGGVPPYLSFSFSGLPAGFTTSEAAILGNSTTAKGIYKVGVTVTDSVANTVKRSYVLKLMSSCM